MRKRYISSIVIIIIIVGAIYSSEILEDNDSKFVRSDQLDYSLTSQLDCQDNLGDCYSGVISEIVDGDTIHLKNGDSIRFTLVNSPEMNTKKGIQSREYLESICPVGQTVHVDEDDGQLHGSYGRVIGIVYCDGNIEQSLNQQIVENGYGVIYKRFCNISEFGKEDWAVKHGC